MDKVKFILLELEFQPRESGYESYTSNSIMPPYMDSNIESGIDFLKLNY